MAKVSVEQALAKAKSHIKKGETAEAQALYVTILNAFPHNKKAQQALATLGGGQRSTAEQGPPQAVIDQLMGLYKQGQLELVVDQTQDLTVQFPKTITLWNMLGASAAQIGKLDQAVQAFEQIISLNPNQANAYFNMGNALKDQGKLEEAIVAYNKALAIKPDYEAALNNVVVALKNLGKTGEKRLKKALETYNKAQALKTENSNSYFSRALALQNQGKLEEAIVSYNKALAIKPDYAEAYLNMGAAVADQGKLEEAIEAYNKALAIKPDYAKAYVNMGVALKDQGKLEEAIEAYNKALAIKPDYAEAHYNMGAAVADQGKLEEAIEAYDKALTLKPDYAEAYCNSSFLHNLQGNLYEGLTLYEWRMKKDEPTARLPRTGFIWDGNTSLKEKSFFIYDEQGLGDIIQFCRYLPLLEQKGAKVIFKVRKELHALLRTLRSNVVISTTDPHETQIDFEAPLMSLPHLFKTQLDTIPLTNPYLYADHEKTKTWGERLRGDKFKIGICWQGSKAKIDLGRSFPLSLFEGLSNAPNVELISLHKGEGESQIEGISFEVTTLGADFDVGDDAFLDTAAVMMNCDLIITSDTAVAHLAGALGCQTWVALKHVPDWRWMLNRPDSPWYPTMTLYRQKISGDWGCVFDAINRDLHILLDQRGQSYEQPTNSYLLG